MFRQVGKIVAERIVRVEEGVVAIEVKQALVHVHARPGGVGQRFGHERRVYTVLHGDFLHDQLVGHHGVGHRKRVGEAQVDLVLGRAVLVMGVFHRDAHLLQGKHRVAAQVGGVVEARQIEVATVVEHLGRMLVLKVEELELGPDVENVAHIERALDLACEHLAWVALEGLAVRRADVAEHAPHRVALRAPREHLEGRGVGEGEHVAFARSAKALDAAAVEAHAVLEGVLELARDDGERLHVAENIGKPEADEVDIAALDGFEHEILFRIG